MSCIRFLIDRFRPDVWWYGTLAELGHWEIFLAGCSSLIWTPFETFVIQSCFRCRHVMFQELQSSEPHQLMFPDIQNLQYKLGRPLNPTLCCQALSSWSAGRSSLYLLLLQPTCQEGS
jgi:hypothetical protein